MTIKASAGEHSLLGESMSSGRFSRTPWPGQVAILLMVAMLPACSGGTIRGISGQSAGLGARSEFQVQGEGTCGKKRIDFGDGSSPVEDFDWSTPIYHTYQGWGGKKTVKVESLEDCVGTAEMIVDVQPSTFVVGYKPGPNVCEFVPNRPPLRKNTKVHITTNNANVRINFGCLLDNCIYDANGINAAATPGYPFPGKRPLSLVLRVGTQVEQGGTDVTFTTNQAGRIEFCLNDDNLADNTGAWNIIIEVDETAALSVAGLQNPRSIFYGLILRADSPH